MSGRSLFLISLVLLLALGSGARSAEPNLVGHWKFDEGAGTVAADSSGKKHDGTVVSAIWTTGKLAGALDFGGVGHVELPCEVLSTVSNEITVTLWQYCGEDAWGVRSAAIWQYAYDGASTEMYIYLPSEKYNVIWKAAQVDSIEKGVAKSEVIGDWFHWAFTKNTATGEMKIYRNGLPWHSGSGKTTPIPGADCSHLWIGKRPILLRYPYYGLIDDFRIYDRELRESEIVRVCGYYEGAYDPNPPSGVVVPPDTVLSWSPGMNATSHDVYLGTDFEDVNDADNSLPVGTSVYKGNLPADSNTYDPEGLEAGKTYYWRIDAVDDLKTLKGEIWSFAVCPATAEDPSPITGAENVPIYAVLSWSPGAYADRHDVYFGVDYEGVSDANTSSTGIYQGQWNLDVNSYGEANTPGEPDSRIWYTWKDGLGWENPYQQLGNGTGAIIGNDDSPFVETNIIHGGEQSMPYTYDNSGTGGKAHYSEAERTFDPTQDWTVSGIKALVLYFHGSVDNDTNEQMYVKLEDGDNPSHSKKVLYDGDANDLRGEAWYEWNIDLRDFTGVDLSNVRKFSIGFGDGVAPAGSGTGKVYFDDIRVYRSKCVLKYSPGSDITDDCVVDFVDFMVLANDWLERDKTSTAVAPNPAGLVGWYKFDETSGSTATDYSGKDYHGTVSGGAWVAGKVGGALDFGGVSHVELPTGVLSTVSNEITVALWQNCSETAWGLRSVAIWEYAYEGTTTEMYIYLPDQTNTVKWKAAQADSIDKVVTQDEVVGDWTHWAFTKNATTGEMKIYQNALLWHSGTGKTDPIPGADCSHLFIGRRPILLTYPYHGIMDDFRVYDYELSQAEILTAAGLGDLYFPLTSRANLYDEEPKNFKSINVRDLAVLAEDWLEQRLWPPQ